MTTEVQNSQKLKLSIQQAIRRAEDQLVVWIQKNMDEFEQHTKQVRSRDDRKRNYGKLEEAQFRNLVRVADSTDSPEVIKNFLRYQLGRDEKWGKGNESLAEKIIADIGDSENKSRIYQLAEEIGQDIKVTKLDIHDIWMELIRRYLGYGARYLVYLNKGKGR